VCAVARASARTVTATVTSTRPAFLYPRFSKKTVLTTTTRFMSDEVEKAKQAAASSEGTPGLPPVTTVFDKILSGEWSSDKVFEDDKCLAFRDIDPQAPVHIVLIPKQRGNLTKLSKASQEDTFILGHLLYVAQLVGKEQCPLGFRIVINDGEHGAQSVYHLHLHILGGRQMTVRSWLEGFAFLLCIYLYSHCTLFSKKWPPG
jgi:histidine triad (HIT) family protein